MVFQVEQECPSCSGKGTIIAEEDRCPKCGGNKVIAEKKRFELEVQRGSFWEEMISLYGEADQTPDLQTGSLVFVLYPKKGDNTIFTRDKHDLWMNHKVPLIGALTGYSFVLTHLDNRKILLKSSGVIQPGQVMKVPGQGMPIKGHPDKFGDLYITFKVVLPEQITPEQSKALLQVLPSPPLDAEEVKQVTEQLDLEKISQQDEDEEGEHGEFDGDEAGEDSEGNGEGGACVQQ